MDIENKPLVDLIPESVAIRKEKIKKARKFAEKIWNDNFYEGDVYEKEYWIKGFMSGLNYNNNDYNN